METESMQITIDLPDALQFTETDWRTELAIELRMVKAQEGKSDR
jgi:hypothetical protein